MDYPNKPNVEIIGRTMNPKRCLEIYKEIMQEATSKKKPLQIIMIDKTKDEMIEIWISYIFLLENKDKLIELTEDLPNGAFMGRMLFEVLEEMFEECKNAVNLLHFAVSLQVSMKGREEAEKIMNERMSDLDLDQLLLLHSVVNMTYEKEIVFKN